MSTSTARMVADLLARVERLELSVAALQRGRGPRDSVDAELLAVLTRQIGSREFSSLDLHAHAGVDSEVAHALVDAGLTTPHEIGCYLRRMRNVPIDGRVIRQRRRGRWYVEHVDVPAYIGDRLQP